jgi:hypothetical protein
VDTKDALKAGVGLLMWLGGLIVTCWLAWPY